MTRHGFDAEQWRDHAEDRASERDLALARVARLEDIVARASRLAESERASLTQRVLQEAFDK